MDEAPATCRLLFLADSQIGCMATFSGVDEAAVERFRRRGMRVRPFPATASLAWDVDRYRQAVAVAADQRPDLVVIGGDMVDAIDRPEQLEAFRSVSEGLDGIDLHLVPGNHDICPDGVIPTEASLAWYRATFGPEHHVTTRPVGGATATLVAINSSVLDQPRALPGADDAELAFLEGALRAAPPGPRIVVSHHPPFLEHPDEPDQYWNLPIERRRPLLELLAEHRVDLVLCGHRHRNAEVSYRGVPIVTSAATGFPLGTDPPGYRTVEITGTGVSHTYYGLGDPGWDHIGGPPEPPGRSDPGDAAGIGEHRGDPLGDGTSRPAASDHPDDES